MRYICLALVLLTLPVTATAQQKRSNDRQSDRGRSEQRRSDDRRSDDRRSGNHRPTQQPTSGLGSIGLPLPPIGLPPQTPWWEKRQVPSWERPHTPAWERPKTPAWEINRIPGWDQGNVARALLDQQRNQPQYGNRRRPRRIKGSVVYVIPSYPYYPDYPVSVETPPPPALPVAPEPPPPPMGGLRLEVEPKDTLQIFVDGVYVGTPGDLGDEFAMLIGTRRIELRAPGHLPLVFVVEIVADRVITYRGALERAAAAPTPPAPRAPQAPQAPKPVGSKTMYLIPGCYMGNVSPKEMALPPGCDISKLTTITP